MVQEYQDQEIVLSEILIAFKKTGRWPVFFWDYSDLID